ncbi:beta-galactosidase [Microlunatus elymi]|uniref:Beta-galactosidase n=1 Tax=Microlunatus elymi TaxID=2596828 RepID=A0A516Q3H2_9ACTN|nr:beta-galactosidase family protein [Microlunatus elymi]QDP97958.1 beta-galactosidase [Microlunatus elymi]
MTQPPVDVVPGLEHFLRNGEPHQIISGALHYFRIPAELWPDRLARLRALGCNTVETYVAWNFHRPYRDRPSDFTGMRDLGRFLDLAAAADLDILVRPGPYICAEWDNGGLPAWLLDDHRAAAALRTSDPAYLDHVDQWFDELLPIIVRRQADRGGRVIGVQVENEYGSFGNDHDYLQHLQDGLVERGVTSMLFTSDGPTELMLSGGRLGDTFATINFGSRQREAFALLDQLQPGRPGMCMEFWNGWFDHWGEQHHTRDAADAAAELDQLLSDGRSVNLYMAHGGTNFGTWAGANLGDHDRLQPTVTSYDYDSPIAEDGRLTDKFHAFRDVISKRTGARPPQPPADAEIQPARSVGVTDFLDLQQILDNREPVPSPTPETFEHLGLHHGVVRYRTKIAGPITGELGLVGLADLAEVRLDGALIGRLGRLDADPAYPLATETKLPIDVAAGDHDLDVTVQSLGRVNFGPGIGDHKGLGRIRLDYQHLFGFEQSALDLEQLPGLADLDWQPAGDRPGFYRTTVQVEEVADAYLELPGWHNGFLYLNGFNLGRYWNPAGPQRTLYAPAPLWRTGANELVILEFTAPGGEIAWRDRPDLG